jgi:hypothetical protein
MCLLQYKDQANKSTNKAIENFTLKKGDQFLFNDKPTIFKYIVINYVQRKLEYANYCKKSNTDSNVELADYLAALELKRLVDIKRDNSIGFIRYMTNKYGNTTINNDIQIILEREHYEKQLRTEMVEMAINKMNTLKPLPKKICEQIIKKRKKICEQISKKRKKQKKKDVSEPLKVTENILPSLPKPLKVTKKSKNILTSSPEPLKVTKKSLNAVDPGKLRWDLPPIRIGKTRSKMQLRRIYYKKDNRRFSFDALSFFNTSKNKKRECNWNVNINGVRSAANNMLYMIGDRDNEWK